MKRTIFLFLALVASGVYFNALLLLVATTALVYVRDFYGPSLYYHLQGRSLLMPDCKPNTDDLMDLLVDESTTPKEATSRFEKYGAAVVENVLRKETAQTFRDFVMAENTKLTDQVFVLESENRYNLLPDMTLPIVHDVIKQVGSHPVLRPLIDRELGKNATLVNFSVLTATYGAANQEIHPDIATSAATQPKDFVKEFALTIALQDTTKEMGATHVCPGTVHCKSIALENPDDKDEKEDDAKICKVHATLKQGDSLLYDADLHHRGTAHTDSSALDRAVLFLIFAESRVGPHDQRRLPFGNVRVMDWRMWGHTIDDFSSISDRPWLPWHSFGLSNNIPGERLPWNLMDSFWQIFESGKVSCHMISNDFNQDLFGEFVARVVGESSFILIWLAYLFFIPLLVLGWCLSSTHHWPTQNHVKKYKMH